MEPVPVPDLVLLINKPLRWTSFDVVNKVRHTYRIKKAGHAGTLDPLATGLLIVCTGKMTKRIEEFQAQEKEYTGQFAIGQTTPSWDLETLPTPPVSIGHISEGQIRKAAAKFVGTIQQIPPQHSAIKVGGKRAYEFAREGKTIELKARDIMIREFEITKIENQLINFRVVCSKGTYIRSLARDFGNALEVGAFLSALCRTRIGDYTLENAILPEQLLKSVHDR
jgi:tRNA pseudouridine55 synthase